MKNRLMMLLAAGAAIGASVLTRGQTRHLENFGRSARRRDKVRKSGAQLGCYPQKRQPIWKVIGHGKGRDRFYERVPVRLCDPFWQIMRYAGPSGRLWQNTSSKQEVEKFRASGRGLILHIDSFGMVRRRERVQGGVHGIGQ